MLEILQTKHVVRLQHQASLPFRSHMTLKWRVFPLLFFFFLSMFSSEQEVSVVTTFCSRRFLNGQHRLDLLVGWISPLELGFFCFFLTLLVGVSESCQWVTRQPANMFTHSFHSFLPWLRPNTRGPRGQLLMWKQPLSTQLPILRHFTH